jgi:hypothetical protein
MGVVTADWYQHMGQGSRADGIGFGLLSIPDYSASGAGPPISEEPDLTNSVGIGFDIYDNGETPCGNNHISLHWNSAFVTRVCSPVDLADDTWHHVTAVIDMAAGTVSVSISGQAVYTNTPLPGLVPYAGRVAFGARTGGATSNEDIDNVSVSFAP